MNGQLCWLTEEAAQGCRVHEGALCVPAVHANMHVISDFWTGITPQLRLLGRRRLRQRRSHCLAPTKTERYHVLITHLENVACVNSSRANIVKYLILNVNLMSTSLREQVNMCYILCTVCVSFPAIQSKALFYRNANKDNLEREKSAIFMNVWEYECTWVHLITAKTRPGSATNVQNDLRT